MSSEKLLIEISSFTDGELEPERVLEVVDRMLVDPEAADFYRKSRRIDQALAVGGAPEQADSLPERLWTRILSRSGLRSGRPWWRAPLARPIPVPTWGFGALAVLLFAVVLWDRVPVASESWNKLWEGSTVSFGIDASARNMSDDRFREMTAELLEADPKYQREMLDVMQQVEEWKFVPEGSSEGRRRRAEGERDERDPEHEGWRDETY